MKNQLGTISDKPDGYQVIFERRYAHKIQKVWNAITDPAQLSYWFTDIEMDFREGGKIVFRFRDADSTASEGNIVKIQAPHVFSWTWEDELAVWELEEDENEFTRLKFTYSKISADYAVRVSAGFHSLLDRLEDRLAGSTARHAFGAEADNREHRSLQVRYADAVFANLPQLVAHPPIVMKKELDAPVERVWKAITDPVQMKEWYFAMEGFKPVLGTSFRFKGTGSNGDEYVHLCVITALEENKVLQYSWSYEGYPGYSLVRFELEPVGNKTRLTLTHHGLETFPKDRPDFAASSFNAGWTEIIGNLLPAYLAK